MAEGLEEKEAESSRRVKGVGTIDETASSAGRNTRLSL